MKKIFLTTILSYLFLIGQAQVIKVNEGTKMMREGSFNAFSTELENIKNSDAVSAWKDFMQEYKAKTKNDKKQNLLISENVQIPSLGRNPIDVYASLSGDKAGSSTSVSIWFDTGSGYVNSIDMEEQATAATKIVEEYATSVLKKAALENEAKEEKILDDLKSELKKLANKDDNLRKDIDKAKENIQKWEKELAQNEDDQDKKRKEVKKQAIILDEATDAAKKF